MYCFKRGDICRVPAKTARPTHAKKTWKKSAKQQAKIQLKIHKKLTICCFLEEFFYYIFVVFLMIFELILCSFCMKNNVVFCDLFDDFSHFWAAFLARFYHIISRPDGLVITIVDHICW